VLLWFGEVLLWFREVLLWFGEVLLWFGEVLLWFREVLLVSVISTLKIKKATLELPFGHNILKRF